MTTADTRQTSRYQSLPGRPFVPFKVVDMPNIFSDIRTHTTRKMERTSLAPSRTVRTIDVIDGFEDLIDEPLGIGHFYNTQSSLYQFFLSLAVSPNQEIAEIINGKETNSGSEVIQALRERQVLLGMRILDLGCGIKPGFALATTALGAETYTVDAEDLDPKIKANLIGHIAVDLNHRDALPKIQQTAGGNIDIVTESIIGQVPLRPIRVEDPATQAMDEIAITLTKPGSYMYSAGFNLLQRA